MSDLDRDITPVLLPMGLDGLIVRFALTSSPRATRAVLRFRDDIAEANPTGVQEIATALTSVLITFDRQKTTRADLSHTLKGLLAGLDLRHAKMPKAARLWHIPVQFGGAAGPQLNEVAERAGLNAAQAVEEVIGADLRVLSIGFAPGQPYIGLLPPNWDFPRQTDLTPKVPAGALVVAVRQLVLFANPSVTGWRQIGCCAFRPFLATRLAPFALRQGDAIRFAAVSATQMASLEADNSDGLGGAKCEVLT